MGYDAELDPSEHVYSHARAFSVHPGFRLMGGVDADASNREAFADRYGCPAYADVPSALAHHQPMVVVIATPTSTHGEVLRLVLDGCRPRAILCEKPLSHDLAEGAAMVDLCAAREVELFVNYIRRADPGAIEVERRIASGEIGTPLKGVAWYTRGLSNNGSHLLNLLELWLGPVVTAAALDHRAVPKGIDRDLDARVDFTRGVVLFLAANQQHFSHYTIELLAPNGRLYYGWGGSTIAWQPAVSDDRFAGSSTLAAEAEAIPSGMSKYQLHVVSELANALEGKPHHLSVGTDALATLETIHTIAGNR
jgi:predicted dehydrogenase